MKLANGFGGKNRFVGFVSKIKNSAITNLGHLAEEYIFNRGRGCEPAVEDVRSLFDALSGGRAYEKSDSVLFHKTARHRADLAADFLRDHGFQLN